MEEGEERDREKLANLEWINERKERLEDMDRTNNIINIKYKRNRMENGEFRGRGGDIHEEGTRNK